MLCENLASAMTLADKTGSVGVRQAAVIKAVIHVVWSTRWTMTVQIIHPAIMFGPRRIAILFQCCFI